MWHFRKETKYCITGRAVDKQTTLTLYTYTCINYQLDGLIIIYSFFSPGATTPIGGCILQPYSGL